MGVDIPISVAYKLAVVIMLFFAMEFFAWDVYTHKLLEETQETVRTLQENQTMLLTVLKEIQGECLDGSK